MGTVDLVILVVLVAGAVRGFMVGAVRQVTSVVGIVAAFFVGVQWMRPVGELLIESLGLAPSVGPLLGFAVVFGGVQLAFFALARLVESLVGAMRLTAVNRMAGGLLGGFKAALLLSVLFVLMARAELPGPEARQQSQLYEPVTQVLPRTWAAAAEHTSQLGRLPAPLGGPGPTTAEGPDQEKGP